MAADIRVFNVTVQPGGSASAPFVANLAMPARRVVALEIVIPSGNRGAVNFALGAAGTPVIPSNAGAFITGDDEVIHWTLSGYIDSGAWQFFSFNLGSFPHTIQVRFLCELVQDTQQTATPALLSAAALSG